VNVYPEIMDKVQFELSPKPSKQQKAAQGKAGFVPVKARWVVERSNAWVERCTTTPARVLTSDKARLDDVFLRRIFLSNLIWA
jgi:hypothetical protein